MTNYTAKTRTNYFKVKDINALRFELELHEADDIKIIEKEIDGELHCSISGDTHLSQVYSIEQDEEVDLSEILQKHLPEGEVCIITEIGSENLQYLAASSYVVTHDSVSFTDLAVVSEHLAKEKLKNPEKVIHMDY